MNIKVYQLVLITMFFVNQHNMDGFFYMNLTYRKGLSFRLNQSFSTTFKAISKISMSDKIDCLLECDSRHECLTIEVIQISDYLVECNLFNKIPNFYSFDVVESNDTKVYVKKTLKKSYNESCFYDNCHQEKGLSCINERCDCKNQKQ